MEKSITKTFQGIQRAEEVGGFISEVEEEFKTTKIIIDMSECNFTPKEKVCVYKYRLLKLIAKKIIVWAFCFAIVNPVTAAFLEAGEVSSVLSLLISGCMANKALEILEELGLEG